MDRTQQATGTRVDKTVGPMAYSAKLPGDTLAKEECLAPSETPLASR